MNFYVCAVCNEPVRLVQITADMTETYEHVTPADHAPLPVPVGDTAICSLCVFPLGGVAHVFNIRGATITTPSGADTLDAGEFTVCRACSALVLAGNWEGIITRALTNYTAITMALEIDDTTIEQITGTVSAFGASWDRKPPEIRATMEQP